MKNEPSPLDIAAYNLSEAKLAESDAKAHRIACEEEVIAMVGLKDEGAKSEKTAWYKVTTTQSITRELTDDWAKAMDGLPNDIQQALVKWEPKLNVRAYKELASTHPDYFRQFQAAVTSKASKPSVKVELIEAQQVAA